jgi:hypothetical protein
MIEIDVAPASAGDPLGRKPPAEAGATSVGARAIDSGIYKLVTFSKYLANATIPPHACCQS